MSTMPHSYTPFFRSHNEDMEGMALEIEHLLAELERRGVTIDPEQLETYHEYREDHPKEDA